MTDTVTTEAGASGGGEAVSSPAIETTAPAADVSTAVTTTPAVETPAPQPSMEDTMRAVWQKHHPARDEGGRFAPRNPTTETPEIPLAEALKAEATETPPAETAKAPDQALPPIEAPRNFTAEQKASFATLPRQAQEFLVNVEKTNEANFTRKTQEHADFRKVAEPFLQAIQPFAQYLNAKAQQVGVHPSNLINTLIRAEYTLSTGTLEQKAQALRQIAADYGVDAQSLFPAYQAGEGGEYQQPDPQFAVLQQQLAQTQAHVQRLTGYLTQQQQAQAEQARRAAEQEQQSLVQTIDDFRKDKPHFEKVRPLMSSLISSGAAHDLATAYDLATNAHPELRQQIIADQLKAAEAKRKAEAEKHAAEARKAASANVKSEVGKPKPKSMDDTMRDAYRRSSAA